MRQVICKLYIKNNPKYKMFMSNFYYINVFFNKTATEDQKSFGPLKTMGKCSMCLAGSSALVVLEQSMGIEE